MCDSAAVMYICCASQKANRAERRRRPQLRWLASCCKRPAAARGSAWKRGLGVGGGFDALIGRQVTCVLPGLKKKGRGAQAEQGTNVARGL